MVKKIRTAPLKLEELIFLDFGCGKNPRQGFEGVDIIDFGQKHVFDINAGPWPWDDNSVIEANASHFIEHLTAPQRIHFVNELHRILKTGGKCQIITPHWASCRAYGDLTHQWPPVSEFWFLYLNKFWRLGDDKVPGNAPHDDISVNLNGYSCDFDWTYGYSMHPALIDRNQEFQNDALTWKKEAAQDLIATITKR